MNVVFIVPTGIGAEIGGHAGDATPAAKLIASICNKLFIHPNIVNASDINEMTSNMLYVEGSILDRFLEGEFGLKEVYSNKILLATNHPVTNETINAVSAARTTIGADIDIIELNKNLIMKIKKINNIATGDIYNLDEMINQVSKYDFDVLVVHTPIDASDDDIYEYISNSGGVNPWGGVEALLSKLASEKLEKPVIHAPVENSELFKKYNNIVDPRKAAEVVSTCYLHCCLKGAHIAPRISYDGNIYRNKDISFLVTPANVVGRPHLACIKNNISVIAVKENKTVLNQEMPDNFIVVNNYLEAVGIIAAKKAGVSLTSISRPIKFTKIIN